MDFRTLARAWGNELFKPLAEEVCLACEQHDIGFLDWERRPTRNPATGLPYHFLEMPTRLHLELWTTGVQRTLRFGRNPALLVSMHFTNIARQGWTSDPQKKELVHAYLEEQDALQTTLKTSLRNDYRYGLGLSDETILSDAKLVSVLDWVSLLICLRCREAKTTDKVPSFNGPSQLRVSPLDPAGNCYEVHPWPFGASKVSVFCEGRRLLQTYKTEDEIQEALRAQLRIQLWSNSHASSNRCSGLIVRFAITHAPPISADPIASTGTPDDQVESYQHHQKEEKGRYQPDMQHNAPRFLMPVKQGT